MAPSIEKESTDACGEVILQQPHPRLVALPKGPACVLAIGTAYPAAIIKQSTYHDELFEMCGVSDNVSLKQKFKRMCKCPTDMVTV